MLNYLTLWVSYSSMIPTKPTMDMRAKHDRLLLFALEKYSELHKWSVENVKDFWETVWHFCGVKASKQYDKVT